MGTSVLGAGAVWSKEGEPEPCRQRDAVHTSVRHRGPLQAQRRGSYSPWGGPPWSAQLQRGPHGAAPPHSPSRSDLLQCHTLEGLGQRQAPAPANPLTGRRRGRRSGRPPTSPPCRRQPRSPREGTPLRVMVLGSWAKGAYNAASLDPQSDHISDIFQADDKRVSFSLKMYAGWLVTPPCDYLKRANMAFDRLKKAAMLKRVPVDG
ncbi:hypothetical protein NDU88_003679 [Pleurodeles waltl]|uniref:Uncharacterized protein n=1 Tax=Pleurodeles waltl TaxID=8319 RepID=A0AAV7UER1_PLEWA|nr:hypothetical protein NDU88_003679 [Pleurodeles waltl]